MDENYPKTLTDIPDYISLKSSRKPDRFGWQWVESMRRYLLEGRDPERLYELDKGELFVLGIIRQLGHLEDLQWVRDNYYLSKIVVKQILLRIRENWVPKRK